MCLAWENREERERGVAEANSDKDPLLKELRISSLGGQQIAARGRDKVLDGAWQKGLMGRWGSYGREGWPGRGRLDGEVRAFSHHGDERRPGRLVSPWKG